MIYVSSACVKNEFIGDSVIELAKNGFTNIELSGGTNFYEHNALLRDLKQLKKEYGLNFLLHNYFPPPSAPFVLNIASNDDQIRLDSMNHLYKSIEFSAELGAKHFGFHAGFYIDIKTSDIGKKITSVAYTPEEQGKATGNFERNFLLLQEYAKKKNVKLYIENNVYSSSNYEKYGDTNPLMLLDKRGFHHLQQRFPFNLLLDVAHLKVSCTTLHQNFEQNLNELLAVSSYIHISDNNGLEDTNRALNDNSQLLDQLSSRSLKDKIITLEIYEDLDQISKTYHLIASLT